MTQLPTRTPDYFCKILRDSDIKLTTSAELYWAKKMKEQLCYVSVDYDKEVQGNTETKYEMPDHTTVTITNNELFRAPEVLFKPNIIGKELRIVATSELMFGI